MKKMNRWLQRCKAAGKTFLAAFAVFLLNTQTAYASGISESKLAKGTEKLIGDATTWLMVLAPVVAGLLIIYFCIRRSAADEMDQKKWNNRIVVAIVSCIGAVIGSATLQSGGEAGSQLKAGGGSRMGSQVSKGGRTDHPCR